MTALCVEAAVSLICEDARRLHSSNSKSQWSLATTQRICRSRHLRSQLQSQKEWSRSRRRERHLQKQKMEDSRSRRREHRLLKLKTEQQLQSHKAGKPCQNLRVDQGVGTHIKMLSMKNRHKSGQQPAQKTSCQSSEGGRRRDNTC